MSKNRKVSSTSAGGGGGSSGGSNDRRSEVAGVIGLGAGLFLLIAMVSLQAGSLVMGPFGKAIAGMFYGIAGVCGYALIGLGVAAAIRVLLGREPVMPPVVAAGTLVGVVSLAVLIHLVASGYRVAGHGPGGELGEHLAEILRAVISTAGTALLACVGLVIAVVVATPLRMRDVLQLIGRGLVRVGRAMRAAMFAFAKFWADVFRAILPERGDRDEDDDDDDEQVDEEDVLEASDDEHGPEPVILERGAPSPNAIEVIELTAEKKKRKKSVPKTEIGLGVNGAEPANTNTEDENDFAIDDDLDVEPAITVKDLKDMKKARMAKGTIAPPQPEPEPTDHAGPVIFEPKFKAQDKATMAAKEKAAEAERQQTFIKLGDGDYQLPSIQLLNYDAKEQNAIDKTAMLELSAKLTQTLENYGVKGDVVAIRPGPVVTMYEFAPAPGTRVNKIVNLTDDLALALEALRVRIVAPIPGKAAVGIEVPNKTREKVFIKEILADEVFRKGRAKLPMAIGKDIEGGPSVVDLARMPHLLVAGTTGSGKSVGINAMITSLLYHCSPEEVRMIMVDPKMLELSIYEGIPHLLLPVVTDPKKANLALRWAVEEMERRYDLLAQMGVRDIATYNEKVAKTLAKLEADKLREAADAAARALEEDLEKVVSAESPEAADARDKVDLAIHQQKLPFIVVVIDEFADLMMCAPKEVETSVARIAQKARAAGIHLILATQRPSVDVITGLIKANFPSRIAFSVASKIDSRTILDQNGAEALLGAGDMLFSDRGAAPVRLHGCYVDEQEIHRVVDHLKTQGRPVYNLDIVKPRDEDGDGGDFGGGAPGGGGSKSGDDMYDKAVYIVTTTRNASISWVQRQLRIGYNRAARIVEEMEKQGVVSPPDHTNKREVLVAAA
jgi:DNA segregation ATPase FtsK/SpoIIIE, S-DNA-T family